MCKNGTTCIPYLIDESTANETYRCRCHKGFTGPYCQLSTTGSFIGTSHISENISKFGANLNISFSFRTTLPNVILFTWDGNYDTGMFVVIELVNGHVQMGYVTGSSRNDLQLAVITIPHSVNDARWYDIELIKKSTLSLRLTLPSPTETCNSCYHSNLQYMSSVPGNSTWFGSAANDFRVRKTVSQNKFVGCMRDIRINDETFQPHIRSGAINVVQDCPRTDQCHPDPCNSNGLCSDLWIKYKCTCDRPYLGQRCSERKHKEILFINFSF